MTLAYRAYGGILIALALACFREGVENWEELGEGDIR